MSEKVSCTTSHSVPAPSRAEASPAIVKEATVVTSHAAVTRYTGFDIYAFFKVFIYLAREADVQLHTVRLIGSS